MWNAIKWIGPINAFAPHIAKYICTKLGLSKKIKIKIGFTQFTLHKCSHLFLCVSAGLAVNVQRKLYVFVFVHWISCYVQGTNIRFSFFESLSLGRHARFYPPKMRKQNEIGVAAPNLHTILAHTHVICTWNFTFFPFSCLLSMFPLHAGARARVCVHWASLTLAYSIHHSISCDMVLCAS